MLGDNYIHDDDQEDLKNLPSFLSGERKGDFSAVPEGYFNNLPDKIMDSIEEAELLDIAPFFSQIPRTNPFSVPADYFEELPGIILSEIRFGLIEKESVLKKAQSNYFEELPQEISSSLTLEKLQIKKEEPFAVPADYFDWLPSLIQDRILATNRAKLSWASLKAILLPKYVLPSALAFLLLVFIGIQVANQHALSIQPSAPIAFNEKDKKEVIDNFELYGFDESIVMDHASACRKPLEESAGPGDKGAAIDFLIENNADMNGISNEN
jgi:hypothetical protein